MPSASNSCAWPIQGVEVLAAVAGRGVHEVGAGIVGDVFAGDERDSEFVAAAETAQWASTGSNKVVVLVLVKDIKKPRIATRAPAPWRIIGSKRISDDVALPLLRPARRFRVIFGGNLVEAIEMRGI